MPFATLSGIETACWTELASAAAQRSHPWRLLALASIDGDAADVRHVLLRECDRETRSLAIYTDARSPKVAQLAAHPHGTLLGWWRERRWQVRLRCRFEVATSGAAVQARWQRLQDTASTSDYLGPAAPGTPVDRGAGAVAPATNAPAHVAHVALVMAFVEKLDWLELHVDGAHRRASFDADGARWLTP